MRWIGRNGLFTGELLKNLKTPGLDVAEVFRRTGSDVARASNRQQIPAVYNQFFDTAYLGTKPVANAPLQPAPTPPVFEQGTVAVATGSLEISTVTAGTVEISGGTVNRKTELPAWGSLPIAQISAGNYRVTMRYVDGKSEEKTIEAGRNESRKVEFNYRPATQPAPTVQPIAPPVQPASQPTSTSVTQSTVMRQTRTCC